MKKDKKSLKTAFDDWMNKKLLNQNQKRTGANIKEKLTLELEISIYEKKKKRTIDFNAKYCSLCKKECKIKITEPSVFGNVGVYQFSIPQFCKDCLIKIEVAVIKARNQKKEEEEEEKKLKENRKRKRNEDLDSNKKQKVDN